MSMPGNDWPTPSEMVVMQILQSRPRGAYGLQIVGDSDDLVKRGSVYVLLGRLEEKGYVSVSRQRRVGHPAPVRPTYQLTGAGARVLAAAEAIGLKFAEA